LPTTLGKKYLSNKRRKRFNRHAALLISQS
jgi:hypothetical protein